MVAHGLAEADLPALAAAVERDQSIRSRRLSCAAPTRRESRNSRPRRSATFPVMEPRGRLMADVLVGNRRLMTTEGIDLGELGGRRDELAAAGPPSSLPSTGGPPGYSRSRTLPATPRRQPYANCTR